MATTCKLIAKTVLGSTTASVTFGSGGTIPQTYDDLLIVISARSNRASPNVPDALFMRFNGAANDTNHSARYLEGNGSSAASNTTAYASIGRTNAAGSTSNTFGSHEVYIPNYGGSTAKSYSATGVLENNNTLGYNIARAGLWDDTTAIDEIEFILLNGSFISGSSFYLYGIKH